MRTEGPLTIALLTGLALSSCSASTLPSQTLPPQTPTPPAESAASLPLRGHLEQPAFAVVGTGSGEQRGPNLIDNGDFSRGLTPWGVIEMQPPGSAPHAASIVGGALCTHVQSGSRVVIGWPEESQPQAFAIRAGTPYRLSFRASASGRLPLRAVMKVGARMPPYQTVASAAVPLEVRPTLLHVDFRSDHDEARGGIAFEIEARPSASDPSGEVCIDDVVLRELAAEAP